MITVAILINGNPIMARSAHRLTEDVTDLALYKVDDGNIIEHKQSDGAIVLAKKLLDTIKED